MSGGAAEWPWFKSPPPPYTSREEHRRLPCISVLQKRTLYLRNPQLGLGTRLSYPRASPLQYFACSTACCKGHFPKTSRLTLCGGVAGEGVGVLLRSRASFILRNNRLSHTHPSSTPCCIPPACRPVVTYLCRKCLARARPTKRSLLQKCFSQEASQECLLQAYVAESPPKPVTNPMFLIHSCSAADTSECCAPDSKAEAMC